MADCRAIALTDASSCCYPLCIIITTDSEEKHHGYTSQEVSQEVWRQNGVEARQEIRQSRAFRIGQAWGQALRRALGHEASQREKVVGKEAAGRQEDGGEARRDSSKE